MVFWFCSQDAVVVVAAVSAVIVVVVSVDPRIHMRNTMRALSR